jgi:hypothetical protein
MLTGSDVRQWRQHTGVSIRALARLLHCHFVTVYNWERQRHSISRRHHTWLMVLMFEVARRQPRRPNMDMFPQCQGTGLIPHNADSAQTPPHG